MKKELLAFCALAVGLPSFAQTTVGAKAGLNYTMITTKFDPEPDEKDDNPTGIGFHAGGYLQIGLSEMFAVRPELMFSVRGLQQDETTSSSLTVGGVTTTTESKSDNKTSYSYIEVPLLLVLTLNENLGLHVGPGVGLLMGGKVKSSGSSTTTVTNGGNTSTSSSEFDGEVSGSDVTDGLRKAEFALIIGGAYETDGGLSFGLRYWRGLNTLNEDTDFNGATVKSTTNMFQLSLGYSFIKE